MVYFIYLFFFIFFFNYRIVDSTHREICIKFLKKTLDLIVSWFSIPDESLYILFAEFFNEDAKFYVEHRAMGFMMNVC